MNKSEILTIALEFSLKFHSVSQGKNRYDIHS